MEKYMTTGLIEKLGKQVGETIGLWAQEDDELEVGIMIKMFEYPGHPKLIIVQTNAVGFNNVKTKKGFGFKPDFKSQIVYALKGESLLTFYNKNYHNEEFLTEQVEKLNIVLKTYDATYQSYIKQAKEL